MLISHIALLATLKKAALLHKRREQATVVPAHSASIFADMYKTPSACWLRGPGSEVKKQSRSNQASSLHSITTQPQYSLGPKSQYQRWLIIC